MFLTELYLLLQKTLKLIPNYYGNASEWKKKVCQWQDQLFERL